METSDISHLRKLLLNLDEGELSKLKKLLNYPNDLALEIAKVLPESVIYSMRENEKLSSAFIPMIENTISRSVAQNPNLLADALYPIIGRSIRKSINEEFKNLLNTFSELVEHTFSPKALKWRYQALVSGKKYSEIVISNTIKYKAEHVFLIHRETGLLLCDVHDEMSKTADPDTISGMLKAITDFVHDSFENVSDSNLNLIELENYQVLIEQGPHAIIASLVKGYTFDNYRSVLENSLEDIHEQYAIALQDFSGDTIIFETSRDLLRKCLITEKKEETDEKKKTGIGLAIIIPVSIFLLFLIGRLVYFNSQWNKYIRNLEQSENILLSQYSKHHQNYYVQGLIMPGSEHPDSLLANYHFPQKKFESKWLLYLTADQELLYSFIKQNINIPENLKFHFEKQQISLSGYATAEWFNKFELFIRQYFAWFNINNTKLKIIDEKPLINNINNFNHQHLYFELGKYKLIPESEKTLDLQTGNLIAIIDQLNKIGKKYELEITGYADQLGNHDFNRTISFERAKFIASHFIENGIPVKNIKITGNGVMTNTTGLNEADMRRVDFYLTTEQITK